MGKTFFTQELNLAVRGAMCESPYVLLSIIESVAHQTQHPTKTDRNKKKWLREIFATSTQNGCHSVFCCDPMRDRAPALVTSDSRRRRNDNIFFKGGCLNKFQSLYSLNLYKPWSLWILFMVYCQRVQDLY